MTDISGSRSIDPAMVRTRLERRDAPGMQAIEQTLENFLAERNQSKIQALINTFSEMIEQGYWLPGDRLPTEKELSHQLNLSVGTVQAAMRALQSANLVERSRRSGTFVAQPHEQSPTNWYFHFRTADGVGPLPWETLGLYVEEITDEGEWSRFLGPAQSYIKLSRLVAVAGEVLLWSEFYLDGQRFSGLLDTPTGVLATKKMCVYIHERFNAPTFRAVHRVAHCDIDGDTAKRLEIGEGEHGIRLTVMGHSYRDMPIFYHDVVIPQNKHRIDLSL